MVEEVSFISKIHFYKGVNIKNEASCGDLMLL